MYQVRLICEFQTIMLPLLPYIVALFYCAWVAEEGRNFASRAQINEEGVDAVDPWARRGV